MSDEELTAFFEDDAQVEVSQGYSLGTGGSGFVRLNLATQRSILSQGLERIRKAYERHIAENRRTES